ncbi:unnamed protein product [Didymodactylos carnosus]|uniref:Uncharacterized protein n=1 Tax=Didymodactylos carnosus TaxID=1234261 RepID=A0A815PTE1_9BILA|nr:unnamed protein product [Didymodactylos carnosus]CAF1453894.1 unnamed protein product [Didymodactylos carnosus]CAF4120003.1 unnamed protein product [Didymodactylos carnosus]CAF4326466.1 unnamed protein product [Didymodactylos carnosus]
MWSADVLQVRRKPPENDEDAFFRCKGKMSGKEYNKRLNIAAEQNEIEFILDSNNYDVNKTVEAFQSGGAPDAFQEWTTVIKKSQNHRQQLKHHRNLE